LQKKGDLMIKILKKGEEYTEKRSEKEIFDIQQNKEPIYRTTRPVSIGTSVIGLYFKDGIIIASDTGLSYGGRILQFKNAERLVKVSNDTLIASSGEYSDFQEIVNKLREIDREVKNYDDKNQYSPKDYANYLARLTYAKRSKIDPLYCQNVIGGYTKGQRYLSYVDLYGTKFENTHIVTGFARYFAVPIITNDWNPEMSEEEVKQIIKKCFTILFYRDCNAIDKIQIAVVDKNGVRIEEPTIVDSKWDYKGYAERANEDINFQ